MAAWLILNLFLFTVPFRAACQQATNQEVKPEETPFVERSQRQFSFYPGGKLEITAGVPGTIKLIGWQRASVLVESERIIRGMDETQAKELTIQFPLRMRWTQTDGTIRTAGPAQGLANIENNLTIYVPKDRTDIKIQILKGNLAIGAINGWIEATLQDGSIEAKSLSGYISVTTKQGDVSVTMEGKRWSGYGFTAITQRGTVDIRLPAQYSAALQLETRDGNFTIDYPEQLVDGESVPLTATAKKNARSLSATVGDGGAPVKLYTASGDIHLIRIQTP
jgi:hypothetical protein